MGEEEKPFREDAESVGVNDRNCCGGGLGHLYVHLQRDRYTPGSISPLTFSTTGAMKNTGPL